MLFGFLGSVPSGDSVWAAWGGWEGVRKNESCWTVEQHAQAEARAVCAENLVVLEVRGDARGVFEFVCASVQPGSGKIILNWSTTEKEDESNWTSNEIDKLKESSPKYSFDLLKLVKSTAKKENRTSTTKPSFGRKLADFYSTDFELPPAISKAFKKIRQLAGIEL